MVIMLLFYQLFKQKTLYCTGYQFSFYLNSAIISYYKIKQTLSFHVFGKKLSYPPRVKQQHRAQAKIIVIEQQHPVNIYERG